MKSARKHMGTPKGKIKPLKDWTEMVPMPGDALFNFAVPAASHVITTIRIHPLIPGLSLEPYMADWTLRTIRGKELLSPLLCAPPKVSSLGTFVTFGSVSPAAVYPLTRKILTRMHAESILDADVRMLYERNRMLLSRIYGFTNPRIFYRPGYIRLTQLNRTAVICPTWWISDNSDWPAKAKYFPTVNGKYQYFCPFRNSITFPDATSYEIPYMGKGILNPRGTGIYAGGRRLDYVMDDIYNPEAKYYPYSSK